MKKNIRVIAIAVCLFIIGIHSVPAEADGWFHKGGWYRDKVKVMTRNLYLGADIFKVIEAAQNPDPALGGLDVPIAVAEFFETVQYTNFPERAEAIADEIWLHRPHLIGLQEVSLWYTQSPSDFFILGPSGLEPNPDQAPADELVYDYLQILQDALAERGLNYAVAVSVTNADVELPMLMGFITIPDNPDPVPTFDDLRMVDRDVILVRGDVDVSNPAAVNYSLNVSDMIGGVSLEFTRGWTAVDATVCGENYRFVNTHLETAGDPESFFRVVQAAQMKELLTILSYESYPIILVGDFNSSPLHKPGEGCHHDYGCQPYVSPYMQATMFAGYLDAWDLILWPRDGFTASFDELVSDPNAELTQRIDLILLKPQQKEIKRVAAMTIGDNTFNMTPSGLWPSDHAGVVAGIKFYAD